MLVNLDKLMRKYNSIDIYIYMYTGCIIKGDQLNWYSNIEFRKLLTEYIIYFLCS